MQVACSNIRSSFAADFREKSGLKMLSARFSQISRGFMTSALRRSDHNVGGVPGGNLPFGIHNRYRLTALFIVFFGSGLAAPFLVLRHQLLKK